MSKIIAFDLDGTLIESKYAIAKSFNAILTKYSFKEMLDQEIYSSIGRPIEEVFERVTDDRQKLQEMVKDFRIELGDNGHKSTTIIANAIDALKYLREMNYKLAIVSNKPTNLSSKVLAQLRLLHFFDFIAGPDLAQPKPSGEMLRLCSEYFNSEIVCMVGDTEDDIRCAENFGIIGLLYDHLDSITLPGTMKHYKFNNYLDLPLLITSIQGE
jgi:HAD superfamily hydrolase (TIGR01549 family)